MPKEGNLKLSYIIFLLLNVILCLVKKANPFRFPAFILLNFLFVALRLETGFDWPAYKSQFEALSEVPISDIVANVILFTGLYGHEPLFVFFSWVSTSFLPSYEVFQALIFVFFLFSMIKLAHSIEGTDPVIALLIVHLYLLFTLEFSTLRQCISMSIFNIGLAYWLNKKRKKSLFLFILSTFFQTSAALYIVAFYLTLHFPKQKRYQIALVSVSAILSLAFGQAGQYLQNIPGFIGAKLTYYFFERNYSQNIVEIIFMLTFVLIVLFFLHYRQGRSTSHISETNPKLMSLTLLTRFLTVLCALFLITFQINTIRNRIFYEIIILLSILVTAYQYTVFRNLRYAVLAFGLIFFSTSLIKSTAFVYIPYQNALWYHLTNRESTGLQRHHTLNKLVRRSR